jgi:four helix bundle suffix protein
MKNSGNDEKNERHGGNTSHDSHSSPLPERLLPPRGDDRTLLSFQKAEVVYDITFRFAHRFLAKGDRTVDPMIQAARSGKKYILEGSKTPQTYEACREFVETRPPEVVANIALCLIHQTNFLMDQQLRRLEKDFVKKGGLRERMTRVRLQQRNGNLSACRD